MLVSTTGLCEISALLNIDHVELKKVHPVISPMPVAIIMNEYRTSDSQDHLPRPSKYCALTDCTAPFGTNEDEARNAVK